VGLVEHFFAGAYGAPPTLTRRTAGALPLLGDGSLGLAMPLRWGATVAAAPRGDATLELQSMNDPAEGAVLPVDSPPSDWPVWSRGMAAALRGMDEAGHSLGGASVLVRTDVPQGIGMAASAALAGAFVAALSELHGASCAPGELTAILAGALAPLGYGPSTVAAGLLGRSRSALVFGSGGAPQWLPFDLAGAELRMMVITPRDAGGAPSSPAGDPAGLIDQGIRRIEDDDIPGLGPVLTAAHVSAPESTADFSFAAALEAGALGARAIEDHGGTCVIALTRVSDVTTIRTSIAEAHIRHGHLAPRILTAVPAVPA
jgi:galactokinase